MVDYGASDFFQTSVFYLYIGSTPLINWVSFAQCEISSLSVPEGVNVATDDDEIDRLFSFNSICLGEETDIVDALLGLVILVDEGWSGEVREDIVPLEDAPEDVIEADIMDDPVIDELKFVEVEYPEVNVFEAVEVFIPETFLMKVDPLLAMLLLRILLFGCVR